MPSSMPSRCRTRWKAPLDGGRLDDDLVVIDVGELDDEVDEHAPEVDGGDDLAAGDEPYELPEIVLATQDDEPHDPLLDTEPVTSPVALDPGEVSDDVLEELRRADIDGPDRRARRHRTTRPRESVARGDHRTTTPLRIPSRSRCPRLLGRKPRVRRVTRVVRHVDPWSVFKIAFVATWCST